MPDIHDRQKRDPVRVWTHRIVLLIGVANFVLLVWLLIELFG